MENNNSTPSDPELPYLSEVIDVNTFKKGQLNIIVAPCHSGKTTATSKLIEAHASCPERVLYLIDTTAGKDSLVMHNEAQRYKNMWLRDIKIEWWGERPDGDGFRVMTYHHFGQALTGNGPDLFQDLDLIICDEMHNLIKYIGIESGFNMSHKLTKTPNEVTICRDALNALCTLASKKEHTPLVLALTATPEPLTKKLDSSREISGSIPSKCRILTAASPSMAGMFPTGCIMVPLPCRGCPLPLPQKTTPLTVWN